MEPSKDPISVRIARINAEIAGKYARLNKSTLLSRESLLDVLQALYDECCMEDLQKYDTNIAQFVAKHRDAIKTIKSLRVNITDFEVKNVIGRGQFGEVHLVKEKQTGDLYAMKSMKKFDNEVIRTSFEQERNIMAYTDSHWHTSLQYAFQDNTYLFFVMEYHPGGDLLGLLYRQGGTLPESAATFYLAELVLALEDLHKMGYVHRDIKPDNILLDHCGHIKLADFGSAARLNASGLVNVTPPVGTPDYIAPEVLQCLDNKQDNMKYGVSCDFWSLGILAYEMAIGSTPFEGQNSTSIYAKIMNHSNNLKFPPDIILSQGYISFIKSLLIDVNNRLNANQIRKHDLFKNLHFDTIHDQVPPYVPKISSVNDTSNFKDIKMKKRDLNIESFKKRTKFSGRNLPFIGFTFTHDPRYFEESFLKKKNAKDEVISGLTGEVDKLRKKLVEYESFDQERELLERKLENNSMKLQSVNDLRERLERDLANNIAECTALKRTLELERKERTELEMKALDLIKGAKLKWEMAEKNKVDALLLELDQHKEKLTQLTATNNILNEQLQHVIKMEGKHKESLEKVRSLSRRSVLGLESRLEEITNDTQETISNLQKRLNDEMHQKNELEDKVKLLQENEASLKQKLEQTEKEFKCFQVNLNKAEKTIKQLNNQITSCEQDILHMQSYKEKIVMLQDVIDSSHKNIKDLENRNTYLQTEAKGFEECKKEMEELKKTIIALQNDKRIAVLESQLYEEQEKCHSLKKQLQESENILTENEELKQLRMKYWRMEKEFGNCKIDKRILERELKDAQGQIRELNIKIVDLNSTLLDNKKSNEAAVIELCNINEVISMELTKVKDCYNNIQAKLNKEEEKLEESKRNMNELKKITNYKESCIKSLNLEMSALKRDKSNLENELQKHDKEKSRLLDLVECLQKEKDNVYHELEKTRREMDNTNLNLAALREACTLLEGQVVEYENINASFQIKQSELSANTNRLIQDVCKAKQDIQEARKQTNEEKSLRLLAETKIKRLQEDIMCLQTESTSYKQQCMEYKQYSTSLSDELTIAEEKISDLGVTLKTYERQMVDLKSENKIIKQEVSEYLTQLNKIKETNHKLNRQLVEIKENNGELTQRLDEIQTLFNEKSNFYKERETKAELTIKQQIKLIDYLQMKIDELNSKKRTLTEVIFGSSKKENQPSATIMLNYKDLETQLLKERKTNKQLNEEIYRLKAATSISEHNSLGNKLNTKVERHKSEILSPRSKVAMEQIVHSPSKQKNYLFKQNSVQRMHHNIPHRYDTKLCTKTTKCSGCSDPISLGRSMNICRECNLATHTHCSIKLPNICGLPPVYAKHYKDSLEPKKEQNEEPEVAHNGAVNVEGWIKLPAKNNGWEKHYACLTNTSINIYNGHPNEQGSSIVQTFPLKPENSHGKVILEPLPMEVGVPVANSDLSFILKVEVAPDTTCWPPKCLIFMTLSAHDKDKWFLALQNFFYEDFEKPKVESILKIPEGLMVNSIMELSDNIKVIGSASGLYSYYEKNILHIQGLTVVHQISIVPSTNIILMIVHSKSNLISCDLNHLINLTQCFQSTKPTLTYEEININNLNGFHFMQISHINGQYKVCVATPKQVIILQYDLETSNVIPIRILDTAEPTSCALFTENSLIVGADKFFEIDLASFKAEEFLDMSDCKLKQAIKCYKMGSFPLAIIQISNSPREYLLCFNEFSVFVDEYGRSTRSVEIKSTHLPMAFHFSKPYLYIIQFAAIEIVKITEDICKDGCEEVVNNTKLELEKFRYIGCNKKGVYVLHNAEIKFVDARTFDIEGSSITNDSTENESDRFSFTSSLVQSLDGNLSDAESIEYDIRQRKVKFSQTNL